MIQRVYETGIRVGTAQKQLKDTMQNGLEPADKIAEIIV